MKIKITKNEPLKKEASKDECLDLISKSLSLDELNKLSRAIPELKKSPLWGFLKSYINKY